MVDFAPVRHISLGEVGVDEVLDRIDVGLVKTFCVAILDVANGIGRNLESSGECHGSEILVVIDVDEMKTCFERKRERKSTPSLVCLSR